MNRQEIFNVIKCHLQDIVEGARGQEILETDSMRDFGADSLEMIDVVSKSIKELGITVPRSEFSMAENLGDLVVLFEKFLSPASACLQEKAGTQEQRITG